MSANSIMTHLIAFYPDEEGSYAAARGLIDGGAAYIELQFPFSDPSADGPVIQEACGKALAAGFNLDAGFALAARIAAYAPVPLFIMSYANPVITLGVDVFVDRAKKAGAAGLIVPDLVPGADEGLYAAGRSASLPIVPVVVPTISSDRLAEIVALDEEYLYAALRKGITGKETSIDAPTLEFLRSCSATRMKVFAGFGIRNPSQIEALAGHVTAPVIGSALVEVISHSAPAGADDIYRDVYESTRRLCGE